MTNDELQTRRQEKQMSKEQNENIKNKKKRKKTRCEQKIGTKTFSLPLNSQIGCLKKKKKKRGGE